MLTFIWVAVGGAAGSLARYGLSGAMNDRWHPWGTVTVNIVGSLILGMVVGLWGLETERAAQIGLAAGLLGGFTTFSTFSIDVVKVWEAGNAMLALTIVGVSVLGGVAAAIGGLVIGRSVV